MTKAQQTYERVNALVDGGTTEGRGLQAARRGVRPAGRLGPRCLLRPQAVVEPAAAGRGRDTARRPRKRETTTQDAIASAVASLSGASSSIESSWKPPASGPRRPGRVRGDAGGGTGRIEEIRAKIAVLDPEVGDESPAEEVDPADTSAADSPAAARPPSGKADARKGAAGS